MPFQAAYRWIDADAEPPPAFEPETISEAQQWIRERNYPGQGILIAGRGNHWHLGNNPEPVTGLLSLKNCTRVVEYSPADMTITVEAGCTLKDLEKTLEKGGQFLPFLPFHSPDSTIGGIVSADLCGPRAGALGRCRDFLIGVQLLHADGRLSHAGGKVVKNVAGYDLCKLYVGALGTLGVLSRLTFKVRPRPGSSCTILLALQSFTEALETARQIRDRIFPAALEILAGRTGFRLAIGLLGSQNTLQWKQERILQAQPRANVLQGRPESAFWEKWSGEFGQRLGDDDERPILLVSTPLSLLDQVANRLTDAFKEPSFSASFLQSSLWACVDQDGLEQRLNRFRDLWTGQPVFTILWKAPASLKQLVEVWDIPPQLRRIQRELKHQYDPNWILNPGRL